jgi:hypothetical protein
MARELPLGDDDTNEKGIQNTLMIPFFEVTMAACRRL